MGGPVERAYLVSVDDLRDIYDAVNDGTREYTLTTKRRSPLSTTTGRMTWALCASLSPQLPTFGFSAGFFIKGSRQDSWCVGASILEAKPGTGHILKPRS
jgi:hypothetical protein